MHFKKVFYLSFNTNIQNPVPRIFPSKIQRTSDPPHKIMRNCTYYSTQLAFSFPPGRNLPGGNDLYHSCTSFEGASWRGQPLKKNLWFIGSGGSVMNHMYIICFLHDTTWYMMTEFMCLGHGGDLRRQTTGRLSSSGWIEEYINDTE